MKTFDPSTGTYYPESKTLDSTGQTMATDPSQVEPIAQPPVVEPTPWYKKKSNIILMISVAFVIWWFFIKKKTAPPVVGEII